MFEVDNVRMVEGFVDFNLGLKCFFGLSFQQGSFFDDFGCVLAVGLLTDEFIAFSKSTLR